MNRGQMHEGQHDRGRKRHRAKDCHMGSVDFWSRRSLRSKSAQEDIARLSSGLRKSSDTSMHNQEEVRVDRGRGRVTWAEPEEGTLRASRSCGQGGEWANCRVGELERGDHLGWVGTFLCFCYLCHRRHIRWQKQGTESLGQTFNWTTGVSEPMDFGSEWLNRLACLHKPGRIRKGGEW